MGVNGAKKMRRCKLCEKPLNKRQKEYCSNSCASQARAQARAIKMPGGRRCHRCAKLLMHCQEKACSKKCKNAIQEKKRFRRTGFTPEVFSAKLKAQEGACYICQRLFADLPKRDVCADHDHETGSPRGILCRTCNVMLGSAKDSSILLARAIEYLEVWRLL